MVDQELLENVDRFSMQQNRYHQLIAHLGLAMDPELGKSAVIDFTVELFQALDFVRRGRLACRRMDLPLIICDEDGHAELDVCLMDFSQKKDYVLVVKAVKRSEHGVPINAPAQLVALTIAAFNEKELLDNPDAGAMLQDRHVDLMAHLDLAMIPEKGEFMVDDFAAELFAVLGYVHRDLLIAACTWMDLSLLYCSEKSHAKKDGCLVGRSLHACLLLVQKNKRLGNTKPINARDQLVAEGVAAFNQNNMTS